MSNETIGELLASAGRLPECIGKRAAWVEQTGAALRAAQRAMDYRCTEAAGRMNEWEFERLCDAELAKVDAIRAPLDAVAERDMWPRHLYFGCV